MIKKSLANKKVVRALTIGLSVLMAAQPMTAFAAENGEAPKPDSNPIDEDQDNGVADDAQQAASDAWVATEDADFTTDNITDKALDNDVISDNDVEEDKKADVEAVRLAAHALIEANKLEAAENEIKDAADKLEIAEAAETTQTIEAEKALDAIAQIDEVVDKANEDLKAADDRAGELVDIIIATSNSAEAVDSYNELTLIANQAAAEVEEASKKVNDLKDEYALAKEAFAAAQGTYTAAIGEAKEEAEEAAKELADAREKIAELQKALAVAEKDVEAKNAQAIKIIESQDEIEKFVAEKYGIDWRKEDKLFNAIMENYYVPQVLDEGAEQIKVEYVRGADTNKLNYFKVTYTVDGQQKAKYFDYTMDGDSRSDILLYDVSDEEVVADNCVKSYLEAHKDLYPTYNDKVKEASLQAVYSYNVNDGDTQYICSGELANVTKTSNKYNLSGSYKAEYKTTFSFNYVNTDTYLANINNILKELKTSGYTCEKTGCGFKVEGGKVYATLVYHDTNETDVKGETSKDIDKANSTYINALNSAIKSSAVSNYTSNFEEEKTVCTAIKYTANGTTTTLSADTCFDTVVINGGDIVLDENDDVSFNKFVGDARSALEKYNSLLTQCNELLSREESAKGKVTLAEEKVAALQKEIENIESKGSEANFATKETKEKLVNLILEYSSEKEMSADDIESLDSMSIDELQNVLDDILEKEEEKLESAKKYLADIKKRSSFAMESLERFEAVSEMASDDEGVRILAQVSPLAATPAESLTAAPLVRMTRTAENATPSGNTVENTVENTSIADTDTALAAALAETSEEAQKTDIENSDVALSATPMDEQQMSWWWALIIAVLGSTGYALYMKNRDKKVKKETKK